jgi:hypothetical protein
MPPDPHLVVDLSGHGYGHAGMTVPVINSLRARNPPFKLTIRTTVPLDWLRHRVEGPFEVVKRADFGMVMADARTVLPEESLAAYARIHASWREAVAAATTQLDSLKPTMLLSNVAYLPLAAAKILGVPNAGLGSINWADIFNHYCGHLHGANAIMDKMVQSYGVAATFLRPSPSMPMPSISNGRSVGPIAQIGRDRRIELREHLDISDDMPIILISLRGVPTGLDISNWPRIKDIHVLVGPGLDVSHPQAKTTSALNISFIDLVRSCDVLITKPGYGLVAEAACNGIPVLLLPWEDWPETSGLRDWLAQHGRVLALDDDKFRQGSFIEEVFEILSMQVPLAPQPSGVVEIAETLAASLFARS